MIFRNHTVRKPTALGLAPAHVPVQPALPGFIRFFAPPPWGPRQAAEEAGPKPLAHPSNPADTTIDTHQAGLPAPPERKPLP